MKTVVAMLGMAAVGIAAFVLGCAWQTSKAESIVRSNAQAVSIMLASSSAAGVATNASILDSIRPGETETAVQRACVALKDDMKELQQASALGHLGNDSIDRLLERAAASNAASCASQ
jgi:hypothetical protein